MPTAVHRHLKIIAFNANGVGGQAYDVRKLLQDLKIDRGPVLGDLKPHMRFYIPKYDIYRTNGEDGHKGGTAVAVKKKKKASFTHASTYSVTYQ
jgi:hypothetical protein